MKFTNIIKHHVTVLLTVLLSGLANTGLGQEAVPLDSLFRAKYLYQQLNGNVLISRNGLAVYKNSFGYQDIARSVINTDTTLFCLASVSKTFTATAVLQLMEKGKLKLDDPLVKYFPGFPYPAVTVRHLLSHTSGLPDKDGLFTDSLIGLQPDKVWQNTDILPALKNFGRLAFAPGDKWSYSNINYNLLALLIEKVSNMSYEEYLKHFIFKPAGMTGAYLETSLLHTTSAGRAINYAFPAPYASILKPVSDLPGTKKWIYTLNGLIGQGGLVMTAADLLRFDQALYNGKLLKSYSLALAFTPTLLNNKVPVDASNSAGQSSYGLGWFILNDTTAGKVVFHTGRIPGELNIFIRNLDKKETVIVLDNAESEALYTTGMNAMKIIDRQPQRVRKLSAAICYAKTLFKDGADAGAAALASLRSDTLIYEVDAGEMDFMGHAFLERGEKALGLETLKTNLLLYPGIWQVYNGYARALLKEGKQSEARLIYELALKLEPKDEEASGALKLLKATK